MTTLRIERIALLEFFTKARDGDNLAELEAALDVAQHFGHAITEDEFSRLVEQKKAEDETHETA